MDRDTDEKVCEADVFNIYFGVTQDELFGPGEMVRHTAVHSLMCDCVRPLDN